MVHLSVRASFAKERRFAPRAPFAGRVTARLDGESVECQGSDLCESGMRLLPRRSRAPFGQPMLLTFALPTQRFDESAGRAFLDRLVERFRRIPGVESVAVCLLFSFLRPEHEEAIEAWLQERTSLHLSLSSEILPEYREFERTATTVIRPARPTLTAPSRAST